MDQQRRKLRERNVPSQERAHNLAFLGRVAYHHGSGSSRDQEPAIARLKISRTDKRKHKDIKRDSPQRLLIIRSCGSSRRRRRGMVVNIVGGAQCLQGSEVRIKTKGEAGRFKDTEGRKRSGEAWGLVHPIGGKGRRIRLVLGGSGERAC
ncbi:hypothetical protein LIER_43627 [Lithospermum erythrorhizon]|uniref:Uncharacterized protein n=1 Tax=Lithospermum erythrorhizon TaxID=34254 RepID=A0AAV3QG41_LITER